MMKLLIATTNTGKIREYQHLLENLPFELVTLQELHIQEEPEETGTTFEENARGKAKFYHAKSGLLTLADDGGLEIDALYGEPGVRSRRWLGREASDEELVDYALARLKGVPKGKRTARFKVVIAIVSPLGNIKTFDGSLDGWMEEKASYPIIPGYPFRSLFFAPEIGGVLSQYPIEEKPLHRARAVAKAVPFLLEISQQYV